jgi:phosphoserine phosphatase
MSRVHGDAARLELFARAASQLVVGERREEETRARKIRELDCRNGAVAIGDAPNDIELLAASGFGVAVATARPEVLAVADATCAPPEDAGVADVLVAFGLA